MSVFLKLPADCLKEADLEEKARKLKNIITDMSFNGSFFADNAARENGKLVTAKKHFRGLPILCSADAGDKSARQQIQGI